MIKEIKVGDTIINATALLQNRHIAHYQLNHSHQGSSDAHITGKLVSGPFVVKDVLVGSVVRLIIATLVDDVSGDFYVIPYEFAELKGSKE